MKTFRENGTGEKVSIEYCSKPRQGEAQGIMFTTLETIIATEVGGSDCGACGDLAWRTSIKLAHGVRTPEGRPTSIRSSVVLEQVWEQIVKFSERIGKLHAEH